MFARIEFWIVLLCALLGFVAMIGFGYLILDADRGRHRYGVFSTMALGLAEVPLHAAQLMKRDTQIAVYDSSVFDGRPTGWSFPAGAPPQGIEGYLLLSRYDGTRRQHVMELVDLTTWTVAHAWVPDASQMLDGVPKTSAFSDYTNWTRAHFREIHPWMAPNGDLVVKDHYSPLFAINACGQRKWVTEGPVYHHSTEADADGNLWVPSLAEPHFVKGIPSNFHEDQISEVSQDGRILFQRSLTDVMLKAGFAQRMFSNGMYNIDPLHLNDIQPVLADGPYWKKGDLFLSLRNLSMIVLYRPATDSVVWSKTGPWLSQHDVDILDDHRIAVYDNHVQDRGGLPVYDAGASDILIYDFAADNVTHPWRDAMQREKVRTYAAGQFTALPGGDALIEDVTDARLLLLSPTGETLAEYVNRAEDGTVYHLGWSRFIDRDYGNRALKAMKEEHCEI